MIKDLLIVTTAQNPAFRRVGGGVVEGATLEDAMVSSTLGSDEFIEQGIVARGFFVIVPVHTDRQFRRQLVAIKNAFCSQK